MAISLESDWISDSDKKVSFVVDTDGRAPLWKRLRPKKMRAHSQVLNEFDSQAKITFDNLSSLLEAGGSSWENAVKVSVFLADINDFRSMNEVYKTYVIDPYPARTTVKAGLHQKCLSKWIVYNCSRRLR